MRYLLAAAILVVGIFFVITNVAAATASAKRLPEGDKASVQRSHKKVSSPNTAKRRGKG
jgi:hypothetical protein